MPCTHLYLSFSASKHSESFWSQSCFSAKTRCLCYRWCLLAKEHLSQRSVPSALQVPSGQIMHGLPVTSESANRGEPWRHLWAFCMFYRRFWARGTFSRVRFLGGFYSSFSPWIMKTFESHSDLKTFSYSLKARKNNPKTPDLGFATGFPYPAGQAPPKGERSSTATWSGKIWGLWIRRDESIWRINEKNGDLQNYTCASYANKK